MSFKIRRWDMRFTDPRIDRVLKSAAAPADPRDSDGKKTVILHGKRVGFVSPKKTWPHAELWGVTRCNVVYWQATLTDWDRWFDIHPVDPQPFHDGILKKRPEAWRWYTEQDGTRPIYLLEPHPDVKGSIAFPRQRVQDAFQTTRFTTSLDWLIALAILEGFERIVLNGIGTRFQEQFQYSHKGILYWIGFAEGRGIDLVIEGPSCYRPEPEVYGYQVGTPKLSTPETVALPKMPLTLTPA